ncbi:MAG: flippase-like domain-containing protein [Blastocatellia bacterium]|nr:flippase-like domain-containing protein [Blastocatellia bacterium]
MRSKTQNVMIVVGTLLSLVFAYLALRKIDWIKAWYELKRTDWSPLFFAFCLMWGGFLVRAVRWKRLIDTGRRISFRDCFRVITIGYMANNLLPARIGEFARAYILSGKNGVSKSFALGTIVTERLGDVVMLVLLFAATLALLPLPSDGKQIALGSAALALTATAGLVVTVVWQEPMQAILQTTLPGIIGPKRTEVVLEKVERFIHGVGCGKSFKVLGWVLFDSVVIWLSGLWMTWYVARACHINNVGLTEILFVMCMVNLAAMLPSAPGLVGTYQASCVFALHYFGIEREQALAFSIVSHIVWYVPLTLVGLIFFVQDKLSWKQLSDDSEEIDDPLSK